MRTGGTLFGAAALAVAGCTFLVDTSGYITGGDEGGVDAAVDRISADAIGGVEDAAALDAMTKDDDVTLGDGGARYVATVQATAGLLAYWRFDEKSGAVVSPTVSTIAGMISGNVVVAAGGLIANDPSTAFTFGGGKIDFGSPFRFAGKTPFSVEAWYRATALTTYQELVTRHIKDVGGWTLSVDQTRGFQFYRESANDGTGVYSVSYAVIGTVYHLVGTFDGAVHSLYVNGVVVGTSTDTSFDMPDNGTTLSVGVDTSGIIDEVAIYDRALAATTIEAHYVAGK